MEPHIRVAAWLRIVWSTLGLLLTLSGLLLFRSTGMPLVREVTRAVVQGQGPAGNTSSPAPNVSVDELADMVMRSMTVVFVVITLLELPGLAAGWGLLTYRAWARPLDIAVSIFDLFSIPIGTAIGAYSLWVMFRPETVELFRNPPGREPAPL
jgi:hypothetical protein